MGKKSGPTAPTAPDPTATAAAQEKTNIGSAVAQANLNRINQVTPQGSLTYTQNGTNADGTPQYTQTQSYSPEEQLKYDQNNKVAAALNDVAISNIGRVQQAQATPFTYDGMTPLQTTTNQGNPFTLQAGPTGGTAQTQLNPTGAQSTVAGAGTATAIDPSLAGKGVQSGLNYSGLTALPGTGDFSADASKVANSVYQQAASRLDPQYQQSDSDLTSRLAAQGITQNSDAYRRAMDNQARAKTDAYNQANYSAIQAGGAEQSRIFGLALGARQQGQNEVNTQGQFANTAQQQSWAQQLAASQQGADVQQQNFGQNLSAADLYNQAQGQIFGQSQAAGQFYNQGQNQNFTQQQSAAQMNNTAQNQYYNQSSAQAAFNNQARQQQIQEAAYLRNVPLNDISTLLNGNSPTSPTFSSYGQVGVQAPDYAGMVQNQYNAQQAQYTQQQQAQSQMLGSIFGGLGTIGAAAISDRRFKENIKRIGTLANGIATYAFNYIGNKAQQFGVMAQEVLGIIPGAVIFGDDGIMRVDYGKVYA